MERQVFGVLVLIFMILTSWVLSQIALDFVLAVAAWSVSLTGSAIYLSVEKSLILRGWRTSFEASESK